MAPMDSFYRIIFYPITYILSPFSTSHNPWCLDSRVNMVSKANFNRRFHLPVSKMWNLRWNESLSVHSFILQFHRIILAFFFLSHRSLPPHSLGHSRRPSLMSCPRPQWQSSRPRSRLAAPAPATGAAHWISRRGDTRRGGVTRQGSRDRPPPPPPRAVRRSGASTTSGWRCFRRGRGNHVGWGRSGLGCGNLAELAPAVGGAHAHGGAPARDRRCCARRSSLASCTAGDGGLTCAWMKKKLRTRWFEPRL
jgi:hypothetical protein